MPLCGYFSYWHIASVWGSITGMNTEKTEVAPVTNPTPAPQPAPAAPAAPVAQASAPEPTFVQSIEAKLPPQIASVTHMSVYGNTIVHVLTAVVVGVVLYFALPRLWKKFVAALQEAAAKTAMTVDDEMAASLLKINPRLFTLLAIAGGLRFMVFPDGWYATLVGFVFAIVFAQIGVLIQPLIDPLLAQFGVLGKPDMKAIRTRLAVFLKTALWGVIGMLSLSSMGFSITPLLGSLGVLGVGGALAFQQMIPGAIKALSFHFSKPFSVGDMIAAGTHQGVVDEIDITTTRLKTADGSLVEVKNEELLSAIVIPPGGPHVIAETLRLSVQVSNTEEQFKLLESLCSTALKDIKDVTFTAVRFSDFAGAGVKTDINYSVLAERKVDARHEVVTALLSALKQANIVFTGV